MVDRISPSDIQRLITAPLRVDISVIKGLLPLTIGSKVYVDAEAFGGPGGLYFRLLENTDNA